MKKSLLAAGIFYVVLFAISYCSSLLFLSFSRSAFAF